MTINKYQQLDSTSHMEAPVQNLREWVNHLQVEVTKLDESLFDTNVDAQALLAEIQAGKLQENLEEALRAVRVWCYDT